MRRKVITVTRRSAEEIIVQFPGGHVAVMRTPQGDYWTQIVRDRDEHTGTGDGPGLFVDGRTTSDRLDAPAVSDMAVDPAVYQVALRIAVN